MKKTFWLFLGLMLAMPAFAQEDGGGGGASAGGGGGNQVFTRIDPVNPLEPVKAFLLSKANITLTPDEEKALRPIVEAEVQQLRDLQTKVTGQPAQPQGGGRRNGRGRGADPNSLAALQSGPAAEEFKRINDEMLAKTTAALNPEHQAALKKYLNSELKKAGGFGALKVTMEEAGAPLSAEQEPQIQGFYSEDAQQRTQLLKDSQGHPDPAKLADIDKATMGKVVKVLTDAQKKALIASRTKQN